MNAGQIQRELTSLNNYLKSQESQNDLFSGDEERIKKPAKAMTRVDELKKQLEAAQGYGGGSGGQQGEVPGANSRG